MTKSEWESVTVDIERTEATGSVGRLGTIVTYYEERPGLAFLVILSTVICGFSGFVLSGYLGAFIGLLLNAIVALLPVWRTAVREHTKP